MTRKKKSASSLISELKRKKYMHYSHAGPCVLYFNFVITANLLKTLMFDSNALFAFFAKMSPR